MTPAANVERVRLLRPDGHAARSPHRVSRWWCRPRSPAVRRRLRLALFAFGVASAMAAFLWLVPVKELLLALSAWIDKHPVGGVLLLPVLFSVAIPLAIPATVLEIASGSVFGLIQGAILNAVGKTCGSLVAFLVGKRLGKQRLSVYLQTKFPVFTALSRVVEGPNWKPLVLLQLSSLPPVVKCYGLSITDVSLLRFAVTSLVGGIPSALLWASIGHQTKGALMADSDINGSQAGAGGRWVVLLVGLTCTVFAMALLFVFTRRELRAQLQLAKMAAKTRSTEDGEDEMNDDDDGDSSHEDTTSDEDTLHDACEVVVTQVAVADSQQSVAKRVSIV